MTDQQKKLCCALVIHPAAKSVMSNEEFAREFPDALEHGQLSPVLLDGVCREKDSYGISCALVVGFRFGFPAKSIDILCCLVEEDWHQSHENVVSALDQLRTPRAVEALYKATQWIPNYLEYDDVRALAVKAIWALGKLGGDEAEKKLRLLVQSENIYLRECAELQLENLGWPDKPWL